ncbi:hypothetical protein MMC31_006359, partial [Peltigera leucophlebia]|nr:hypothetical protein [Peltigera leucophlebia]
MDAFINTYVFTSSSTSRIAAGIATSAVVYGFSLAIYRLLFSPIARFPGPKLAALTNLYEFYYDFFGNGKYIFQIEKMHEKYGPIVRITPYELSIHDPDFYDKLYVSGSVRRTELQQFCKGIDIDGSHFLTTDHDLHRRRRKPLEPFFSRLGVKRLEPMIVEAVSKLIGRFEKLKGIGTVIRLDHAFSAFSADVIGNLCCVERASFLDNENFSPETPDMIRRAVQSFPLVMGFPLIISVLSIIPESFVPMAFQSHDLRNFRNMAREHIIDAKRNKGKPTKSNSNHVSLFSHIVESEMQESELSVNRLSQEAQVLLGTGMATVARTLEFICYYVITNENIKTQLQDELRDVMSGYPGKVPSWADLEKLPYLQALIKEGLRLSYGIMHRLPRVSPDVALQYNQWTIPAG